jgi:hypothetical protein
MKRVTECAGAVVILVFWLSVVAAFAQDQPSAGSVQTQPRFSLEGAAGPQIDYRGSMQSVAFGFAPTRSLTLLVSAERSHIRDEITRYPDGYSAQRGGTTQFVSAELRYAFFPSKVLSPYGVIGRGSGTFRQNVSELFPDTRTQRIDAFYLGAGVRIPARRWLDAFVDARLITQMITTGDNRAEMGIFMPLRAGLAWRF